MHKLAALAALASLLTGCDDSAVKAKNDARLADAIRAVMCSGPQDDRAEALARVVNLAVSAVPEAVRQSTIQEAAAETKCEAAAQP